MNTLCCSPLLYGEGIHYSSVHYASVPFPFSSSYLLISLPTALRSFQDQLLPILLKQTVTQRELETLLR